MSTNNETNKFVLLTVQNCYYTYLFTEDEAEEILNEYLLDEELHLIPFVLSDRFIIPQRESTLKFKKEIHILNEDLKKMQKK